MNEVRAEMLRSELLKVVEADHGHAIREAKATGWTVAQYVSMTPDRKGINHSGEAQLIFSKGDEIRDRTHRYKYITPVDRRISPHWRLQFRNGD